MYRKAIVVGRGKSATNCARLLAETGIHTEFYTVNNGLKAVSRKLQANEKTVSNQVVEKTDMERILLQEQEKTLLVSAANPWLIPRQILEKENLTAVNFHSALLPRHPGRNAEAWAIYEQDTEGGITWHFVNAQVDAGDIIAQKAVPITDQMTAFQLLHAQNNAAVEVFAQILPDLLAEKCTGVRQSGPREKLHYSWEKPNDGVLDLSWNGAKISAFLRAMDYGMLKLLGDPVVCWEGQMCSWRKYGIAYLGTDDEGCSTETDLGLDGSTDSVEEICSGDAERNENNLVIHKNGIGITLFGLKRENDLMEKAVKYAGGGYTSI